MDKSGLKFINISKEQQGSEAKGKSADLYWNEKAILYIILELSCNVKQHIKEKSTMLEYGYANCCAKNTACKKWSAS